MFSKKTADAKSALFIIILQQSYKVLSKKLLAALYEKCTKICISNSISRAKWREQNFPKDLLKEFVGSFTLASGSLNWGL